MPVLVPSVVPRGSTHVWRATRAGSAATTCRARRSSRAASAVWKPRARTVVGLATLRVSGAGKRRRPRAWKSDAASS
eukprot:5846051-Pyramimonas_sp.AAC.1